MTEILYKSGVKGIDTFSVLIPYIITTYLIYSITILGVLSWAVFDFGGFILDE